MQVGVLQAGGTAASAAATSGAKLCSSSQLLTPACSVLSLCPLLQPQHPNWAAARPAPPPAALLAPLIEAADAIGKLVQYRHQVPPGLPPHAAPLGPLRL